MANTTKNKVSKCVMARIRRQGVSYQENFTLKEYRTWTAAEEAAQKWVRKMKRKLGPASTSQGVVSKRNQSGVVGVHPRIDRFKSSVGVTDYCRWYARWPGCPLRGGIGFSADKFGDNDAFIMACLAREHETVDRKWVEKKMKTFKGTKKYHELLSQKKQDFVDQS